MNDFAVRRPHFVDGMLLIAEDLSLEQSYFDRRLRQFALRNGWGVVEGLDVTLDNQKNLAISPGYAINAQGKEIVLDATPAGGVKPEKGILSIRRSKPKPLTASDIAKMSCASLNAGIVVRCVEQAEVQIRQWGRSDLEIGWVPVAFIEPGAEVPIVPITRLTTISELSWTHGGSKWPGAWWIKFSAPVDRAPVHTLEIRIRSAGGGAETIVSAALEPDEARTQHSFKIEPGAREKARRKPEMILIQIRLACDFVLDWKGDPVSGAHLGGQVPSGNGVAGGLFESWLTVPEHST